MVVQDPDNVAAESVAAESVRDVPLSVRQSLRLSLVPGIGPLTHQALLDRFGTPEAVLSAAPCDLRFVEGVGTKLVRAISLADDIDVDTELELCRANQIEIVPQEDATYPRALLEIHDPPGVLFRQGSFLAADNLAIAIVGTRHATAYGKRIAARLAGALARAGLTIVSGLAHGIDAAAHQGALDAGGRTMAVLGGGMLSLYPPDHKELAFDICHSGALWSESPPRQSSARGAFPRRNRIITGMSLGLVVVEAPDRSGALISARHAMEQGREVFAVPGPVDSRASKGCHALIRDGAKLVESPEDVLEELGPLVEEITIEQGHTVRRPSELSLNEQEQTILQMIETLPTQIDDIVMATKLPVQRILATLSVLEMKQLIHRTSGTSWSRR